MGFGIAAMGFSDGAADVLPERPAVHDSRS